MSRRGCPAFVDRISPFALAIRKSEEGLNSFFRGNIRSCIELNPEKAIFYRKVKRSIMEKVTDILQLDPGKKYTYADYLNWQFNERVELIKGWLYRMSPAPKRMHQSVSMNLSGSFWYHFRKKTCRVFDAPFDVRLRKESSEHSAIDTVVQPDICIVCDVDKLDDAGCLGAPDLIVEILSESTAKKDYNEKFNLYEENRVKEYWIANPATNTLEIYTLEDNTYQLFGLFDRKNGDDLVAGQLFPDLQVSLVEVFTE